MDLQKWEILLFAEDVVSYLMNTKLMWKYTAFSSSNAAPRAGDYREFVYNGFDEVVQKAVDVLYDSLFYFINNQFSNMIETSNVNDECFKRYSKFLWEQHFSDGIDAISFLRFCAVVTGLAGAFYLEGIKKSPDYAAQIIVYHFPRAECLKVTWEVLHKAAINYLKEKTGKPYPQFLDALDLTFDIGSISTCSCFKTNINAQSFKKIYDIREKVLRYHFLMCMRANFEEAYKQNLMMTTEDFETDDILPAETSMGHQYFSEHQASMSAILKISQAGRCSDNLSDNYDYTISRNSEKVIPRNSGYHNHNSGVPKCSEMGPGTFLSSSVPKESNNEADSFIFKMPKSVKRFKKSDNENGSNSNKGIQQVPDIFYHNKQTHESDFSPLTKISEIFKNLR